jgi:hypothetical protein
VDICSLLALMQQLHPLTLRVLAFAEDSNAEIHLQATDILAAKVCLSENRWCRLLTHFLSPGYYIQFVMKSQLPAHFFKLHFDGNKTR